jgi:oxalate decarboxylase/phosphoglucose isomerase-like protein (cupin superfamily)
MAKIDLKNSAGFQMTFNGEDLEVKDASFKEKKEITIDEVRKQLLNKELSCPDIFYKKYKELDNEDIYKSKGVKINFYTLKPNLAGIEYVKTRATRCNKYPRIIETVHGGATILLQDYDGPKKNRVIITSTKKKQKIIVPSGFAIVVVNARQNSNLVFSEYMSIDAKPQVALDERDGLAYYIIRKNAKQEIVRNPSYKIVNEPEKEDWDKIIEEYGITPKTPIIKQIVRKYERFDWLFKENSVSI